MSKLSGGQALVKSLVREGVEYVFGVPGVQMYGIISALRDEPSIKLIVPRHEQATTYMADGYFRSTGKTGVALVVPGPGIYNAGAGLSTAYSRSSSVVLIAGQIPRKTIGKDFGGLHEVNDQLEITRPITKWQKRIFRPNEVPEAVHMGFNISKTGRSRPVHIELPPETMVEKEEVDLLNPIPVEINEDIEKVDQVIDLINISRNPVIYAGGGIARSNSEDLFMKFVDRSGIPVITSASGKGIISDDHPLALGSSLGPFGYLKEYLENSDLIIAIGTRFSLRNPITDNVKVIHIDVDKNVIGKIHKNSIPVITDLRSFLKNIIQNMDFIKEQKISERIATVTKIRKSIENSIEEHNEPQRSYLNLIREGTPKDSFFIAGMTQLGYYSRPHWKTYFPKTYIDSGYSGNLGFSFPTSLGVKIGNPDKPVVCLSGDGGFMYNSSELSTAVKYGINIVTIIYNDGAFGNVARDLDDDFGGTYETSFTNPDFVKLAESYGAIGLRANEPKEISNLITEGLSLNKPVIIDMPVSRVDRPKIFSGRAPWMSPQDDLIN
tara:strand:+ start:1894 stop:3546 length:1653 start_codon:yes stop_codon:yes gene_type:complete